MTIRVARQRSPPSTRQQRLTSRSRNAIQQRLSARRILGNFDGFLVIADHGLERAEPERRTLRNRRQAQLDRWSSQTPSRGVTSRDPGRQMNLRPDSPQKQKKPTRWNALRHSTASAYSATSLPAPPGCSSLSRPTAESYVRLRPKANTSPFWAGIVAQFTDGTVNCRKRLSTAHADRRL